MTEFTLSCPIPISQYPHVLMAHGGGGRLMNQLIEKMFISVFDQNAKPSHDSIVLPWEKDSLVFTTDSFVVKPLFFPGGDIGALAVYGTVNDVAMSGAKPLYLSAGFIIEEGFPMETLWRVVQSMKKAADRVGVKIVTGDTKVVDKGKGDGIYINTAGVGVKINQLPIQPQSIRPGDVIYINGDLGRHGMSIMSAREGIEFESQISSDLAPLSDLVSSLLNEGIAVHCLRDLTRGGLASALNEIAGGSNCSIQIDERKIPVRPDVQAACEVLGLDPLHVANEGRLVAFISAKDTDKAERVFAAFSDEIPAARIGEVVPASNVPVRMKSRLGVMRILDMHSGEQLPRIC